MSTTTASLAPSDALVAQAQYERTLAETRKFAAEQNKLAAEQNKLSAEAAKLSRDRFFAPFIIAATLGSGLLAAIAANLLPLIFHLHK